MSGALQALRVPANSRQIMKHAMRAMMLRMADAVEGKIEVWLHVNVNECRPLLILFLLSLLLRLLLLCLHVYLPVYGLDLAWTWPGPGLDLACPKP